MGYRTCSVGLRVPSSLWPWARSARSPVEVALRTVWGVVSLSLVVILDSTSGNATMHSHDHRQLLCRLGCASFHACSFGCIMRGTFMCCWDLILLHLSIGQPSGNVEWNMCVTHGFDGKLVWGAFELRCVFSKADISNSNTGYNCKIVGFDAVMSFVLLLASNILNTRMSRAVRICYGFLWLSSHF